MEKNIIYCLWIEWQIFPFADKINKLLGKKIKRKYASPISSHKQKNTWSEEDVHTSAWDLKRQYKCCNFGLKAEIQWSLKWREETCGSLKQTCHVCSLIHTKGPRHRRKICLNSLWLYSYFTHVAVEEWKYKLYVYISTSPPLFVHEKKNWKTLNLIFYSFVLFFSKYRNTIRYKKKRRLCIEHNILSCFYTCCSNWRCFEWDLVGLNYERVSIFLKHTLYMNFPKTTCPSQMILIFMKLPLHISNDINFSSTFNTPSWKRCYWVAVTMWKNEFGLVLWHINHCKLFNAKSAPYIYK